MHSLLSIHLVLSTASLTSSQTDSEHEQLITFPLSQQQPRFILLQLIINKLQSVRTGGLGAQLGLGYITDLYRHNHVAQGCEKSTPHG